MQVLPIHASAMSMMLFLIFTNMPGFARAEDRYFIGLPAGGSANWSDPGNWSGGSVPTLTDVTVNVTLVAVREGNETVTPAPLLLRDPT